MVRLVRTALVALAWIVSVGPVALLAQGTTPAQVTPATPPAKTTPTGPQLPIIVVNIASIDRVLTDVDYMFKVAERPDMMELVAGVIASQIGDLKGMNRQKPFGVMLFLAPGLPPTPTPILYVPVDGIEDLMKIVEQSPVKPKKVEGDPNRYELIGRRGNFHCLLKNGYAYLTNESNKAMLDSELPEPAAIAEPMAAKYDLGVAVMVRNIPLIIRNVFLVFLRQNIESQLQQRDNEPEAAYKLRRANGISTVEFVEQVLTQVDQLQLGIDASQERKNVEIEILMDATPDSEMAKLAKDLAGRKSYFFPLFDDGKPLTVSASWKMDKRERKAAMAVVDAMKSGVEKSLLEREAPEIGPLFDSMRATAEQGDMDFCVQFQPVGDHRFVIVGGARILGGESFGKGLEQLLTAVQGREELEKVEINAASHANINFHRLLAKNVPEQEKRTYGGTPSVYLGASPQTVWFAVGADEAMTQLRASIDATVAGNASQPGGGSAYPFQMILHTAPWLNLPALNEDEVGRQDFAKKALTTESDAVRISVQPTNTGTRSRFVVDEGFVKLIGMLLARQYDQSQL